jgi:peptidyl-tRNA hydrolase
MKIEKMENQEIAMYIFVNYDLKMGIGKIAGQVGHITQKLIEDILLNHKHSKNEESKKIYEDYRKWKKDYHCAKIILKATQEDIEEYSKLPNTFCVYDAGKTQIEANSLTVVGFYPSSKKEMHPFTHKFKLL